MAMVESVRPVALATARLVLRPWRETDADAFHAINADPAVMAYFPAVLDRSQSDAMMQRIQQCFVARGWGLWALERKQDAAFLGFAGLWPVDTRLPFAPAVEVGWRLAKAYWGQGYATEAARQALDYAFTELNLENVVSFSSVDNRRSRRVMQRIGLRDTGECFDHPALEPGHPLRIHCLYRLQRAQWRENYSS